MEPNKTYTFEVEANFGSLSKETVNKLFTDGRVASHFLEEQLTEWFPDLTFVDGKGYDHVDIENNQYDQKSFTKRGTIYAPSNMVGKGRKIDEAVFHAHAKNISYILTDVIDFPTVRVVFKRGSDLLKEYPNGKIPLNARSVIFDKE